MSADNRKAYPLCWPAGWPQTEDKDREFSKFKQSLSRALNNLKRQIELMGGSGLVLSSNYTLGNENPKTSGVVAYFTLDNNPIAIPCDRWRSVEDNVHAIALTVGAMRGIERWGAKHMIKAMFTGFKALPEKTSGIDPWAVLGLDSSKGTTEAEITAKYRSLSKQFHPDNPSTGDVLKWAQIREAHDLLMATVRSK